jgi:hypothetical protein
MKGGKMENKNEIIPVIATVIGILLLIGLIGTLTGKATNSFSSAFYDSDGGKDYYTKGYTYGQYEYQMSEDTCSSDGTKVIEWYTNANYDKEPIKSQAVYTCPQGCQDGACVGNCEEGSTRCLIKQEQRCVSGEWQVLQNCKSGCGEDSCRRAVSILDWLAYCGK